MQNFDNTQVAFRMRSDGQLIKAYRLFRMIEHSFLVSVGNRLLKTALYFKLPIKFLVLPIYRHFVGGESLALCTPIVNDLLKCNVKAILDYSVEGKEQDSDIDAALGEMLNSIQYAREAKVIPFVVFKPTALSKNSVLEKKSASLSLFKDEELDFSKFVNRVDQLCSAAFQVNIPILIDAEHYYYQKAIDDVTEQMMMKYNKDKAIVFNTLQMYRHDRLHYLEGLYQKSIDNNFKLGLKFVRGAYMEHERERAAEKGYPSPIHISKQATDCAYNAALKFSIEHINQISIFNGTHNEQSCLYLTELMVQNGILPNDNRVWFAQLYGMSDHISFNLAEAGYNVAKYVPYGPVQHVMPYLMRRAEENTSVAGQTPRELSLLKSELDRRRKA